MKHTYFGIDLAIEPDFTSLFVCSGTASEVIYRLEEARLRLDPMITDLSLQALDRMLQQKVPCIRYGRRKRKMRRLLPRTDRLKVFFPRDGFTDTPQV